MSEKIKPKWATYLTICMAAKGMTQEALASKCGVSRPTIGEWLAGNQTPDIDKYERAMHVLGGNWIAYQKLRELYPPVEIERKAVEGL